jgi:quercetin dioxygenase-like cupin family protein
MERVPLAERETVEAVEGVYLTQLAVGENMSVQHFHIEPGAVVPEHDHHHEQAGWVESGEGVFIVDGEELLVQDGDSYTIPGGEPHAVEVRGDEALVGVDIFHPPREAPDWGE